MIHSSKRKEDSSDFQMDISIMIQWKLPRKRVDMILHWKDLVLHSRLVMITNINKALRLQVIQADIRTLLTSINTLQMTWKKQRRLTHYTNWKIPIFRLFIQSLVSLQLWLWTMIETCQLLTDQPPVKNNKEKRKWDSTATTLPLTEQWTSSHIRAICLQELLPNHMTCGSSKSFQIRISLVILVQATRFFISLIKATRIIWPLLKVDLIKLIIRLIRVRCIMIAISELMLSILILIRESKNWWRQPLSKSVKRRNHII